MKKAFGISVLFILLFSSMAMAHSIKVDVSLQSPAVTVFAGFSITKPISNAKVEVFAPDSQTPFQVGRTDINGNFAFLPKTSGEWRITIDDEMGHFGKKTVIISHDFFQIEKAIVQIDINQEQEIEHVEDEAKIQETITYSAEIPMLYRALFGLAIIFGITGFFYGFQAKRKLKQ